MKRTRNRVAINGHAVELATLARGAEERLRITLTDRHRGVELRVLEGDRYTSKSLTLWPAELRRVASVLDDAQRPAGEPRQDREEVRLLDLRRAPGRGPQELLRVNLDRGHQTVSLTISNGRQQLGEPRSLALHVPEFAPVAAALVRAADMVDEGRRSALR